MKSVIKIISTTLFHGKHNSKMRIYSLLLTNITLILFLTGCSTLNYYATTYGEIQPQGSVSDCGTFTFTSFDADLRVSPRRFGDDTLVAYVDMGPDIPRNSVFLIAATDGFQSANFSKELYRMDPKHPSLWKEAVHLGGDYRGGDIFWAHVPEKSHTVLVHSTIVEREEIKLVGRICKKGQKKFLLLHVGGTAFLQPVSFATMKQRFQTFQKAIKFKEKE